MARIKVDVVALRQNKATIERKITDLQALNGRLESLLNEIENSWEGKASDQYISKMREHKRKADQMITVLSEFKEYIESAADRFEKQDKDGASRITISLGGGGLW